MNTVEFNVGDIVKIKKIKIDSLVEKDYVWEFLHTKLFLIRDITSEGCLLVDLKNSSNWIPDSFYFEKHSKDDLEIIDFEVLKNLSMKELETEKETNIYITAYEYILFKTLCESLGNDASFIKITNSLSFDSETSRDTLDENKDDTKYNPFKDDNASISFLILAGNEIIYESPYFEEPFNALENCIENIENIALLARKKIATLKVSQQESIFISEETKTLIEKAITKLGSESKLQNILRDISEDAY